MSNNLSTPWPLVCNLGNQTRQNQSLSSLVLHVVIIIYMLKYVVVLTIKWLPEFQKSEYEGRRSQASK